MNARRAIRHQSARPARPHRPPRGERVRRSATSVAGPAAWAVFVALAIVVPGVVPVLMSGAPSQPGSAIAVRVGPADTLWSIASVNRLPGRSTVETVEEILRINGLTDSRLAEGIVLRVPALESAHTAFAAAGGGDTAP
jgi:hypothetical protein